MFIEIRKSTIPNAGKGVFTKRDIMKGEMLEEYRGIIRETHNDNSSYVWEIIDKNDKSICFIDGEDKRFSNWTRYVNSPCNKEQENVEAIQIGYRMFYYAKKNIKKGEELFVWYGSEYGLEMLGIEEL